MRKSWLVFVISLILMSCQWIDSTLPNEQNLLEEELNKIDWTKVDTFPSFEQCDTIADTQLQNECFISNLVNSLQHQLSLDTLKGKFVFKDTLRIAVIIKSNAEIELQLQKPDSLTIDFLRIDSLLQNKNIRFSGLVPATKRGVPVNSQFVIPIVLEEH